MGVAQQKEAAAYFTPALTSAGPPDTQVFLTKIKQFERVLCGGSELGGVAEPAAHALLEASATSQGQLRWLLQLSSTLLTTACQKNGSSNDNSYDEPANATAAAVLHVTELLLRHLLRLTHGQSALLVSVLECGGSTAAAEKRSSAEEGDALTDDAAALLCRACLSFTIGVPLSQATVLLHLEVLRLLLTLTSSALHHSTEFREDTMDLFTELLMAAPQLHVFLATLLKIVAAWGKADWGTQSPVLYHEGCQPSMRNFFQVFGGSGGGGGGADESSAGSAKGHAVPYVLAVEAVAAPSSYVAGSGVGASGPKDPAAVLVGSCSCWQQLGRHAAALLCVLTVHQKGSGRNPALEYVVSIQDGSPVAFVRLLSAIRWKITRYPEMSILLYVLLHDHHEFLHTVLNANAALLVTTLQQLLELTYKTCKDAARPALVVGVFAEHAAAAAAASEDVLQKATLGRLVYHLRVFSYPFINFMSSTLLLLLSQDCVVNRLLCNTPCLPGHLLERHDPSAPVGALAIVVLALGITKGFNERNEALIAVFAPCLVNLAPFVHDVDPYTAQRVSSLLTLVLKKIHRAGTLLSAATATDAVAASEGKDSVPSSKASAVASAEDAQALEEILAMYLRQFRTIVEGVEALLRGPNRRNEHLVYELLYARGKIIDEVESAVAAENPFAAATKQLLTNIVEMIKNCEAEVASSDQAQNPQEIMAILRRGQRQGSSSGADGVDSAAATAASSSAANAAVEMVNVAATSNDGANAAAGGTVAVPASNVNNSAALVAGGGARSPGPDGVSSDGALMDLVYSYEESPHSYDFFGPFVWSILLSAAREPGAALWCHRSSELALFPH